MGNPDGKFRKGYLQLLCDVLASVVKVALIKTAILIIPMRRSRLSGKLETIRPDRRKPLQFIGMCGEAAQVLLGLRWIQPIDLSHGDISFRIKTLNRDLV